ncbi:MAG: Hpt domain-containing protein [Deltaproteobacteria bacterium]|nr:Hpt domain-containing protein [Deltaproteobacteria bacterium]
MGDGTIEPTLDLINLDDMMERFGDDRAFIDELLESYFQEAAPNMNSLAEAVATGDAQRVCYVAHALKGMSGNMGFGQVQDAFFRMETLGKSGKLDGADALLVELRDLYRRLEADYQQILGR